MKIHAHGPYGAALLALGIGVLSAGSCPTLGAALEISIIPQFAGERIRPDSVRYQTSAGESFSLLRISYLLSGFALERPDGSWLECTNEVAWMNEEKGRNTVYLDNIPAANYRGVRFHVGLDERVNHADVSNFPPGHPLNANLNELHWNWQGGFIFLALEGLWRSPAHPFDGWSYHLAGDTNRTRIQLDVQLDMAHDTKLNLDFDLAALFHGPRPLSFARDGSSTHSRAGDPIAAALAANLPGSFRAGKVGPASTRPAAAPIKPLYWPEKFTPYRFQTSATFPRPDLPHDNPLIEERVALGAKLFHETALSKDGTISCASCHDIQHAFSDPRKLSIGVQNRVSRRNSMPLFNLAWKSSFFWDGRASSLRTQALMPIQDHAEMDETLTNVTAKLRFLHDSGINYPALFSAAFGSSGITPEKIGLALEQFLLTSTSLDSRFDRALKGQAELSEVEQRGFELFMTEYDPSRGQLGADCFHCHGGPLFRSQAFANNGLDTTPPDAGRFLVTHRNSDKGRFAVPSLRNVALTAPYMHDGRFATLEEVVEHYSTGVQRSATLDPSLAKHPTGGVPLSAADKHRLVAFLRTLTDEQAYAKVETRTTNSPLSRR